MVIKEAQYLWPIFAEMKLHGKEKILVLGHERLDHPISLP